MNERLRNQEMADLICQDLQWDGHNFCTGNCVALLNGKVIAVTKDLDNALKTLRAADPDPSRGMVMEVTPPTVDVIR